MSRILEQVRNNAVSLMSLVVAVSALLYTSWRYEESEFNWNVRVAGFEMLVTLGELQRVVYLKHYDRDEEAGNPRNGWVHVMVLRDLGAIMPEPLPDQSVQLLKVWESHWAGLGRDGASVQAIEAAVDQTRSAVLEVLGELR